MMTISSFRGLALACLVAALPLAATSASAGSSATMTTCSANYKADKAAGQLAAGQTWPQYLSACSASLKASGSAAAAPAPAPVPVVAAAAPSAAVTKSVVVPAAATKLKSRTSNASPTPGQQAMYDRERQCGAMWKQDKAAGNLAAGETWPQYWSACNTKLKG